MAARRCSDCGISYPNSNLYILCRHCRQATSLLTNVDPDPDWEYAVALKGMPDRVRDENSYWWRAEELYRAGLPYEQAMLLAGHRDVDLHEAIELIEKAGPRLAYDILS